MNSNSYAERRDAMGRSTRSKLDLARARRIRKAFRETGCTQTQLAERYNVSNGTISMVISNQIWKDDD